MATPSYQSPITKKWFSKANAYVPKKGVDYNWVWEYAKFRLAWATDRVQLVDSKALEFIKVIIVAFAAFWTAIKLLSPSSSTVHPRLTMLFMVLSYFSLFLSGVFALWAYSPKKRLLPVAEDAALACADKYEDSSEAIAKFCQTLSAAVEYETDIAARHGNRIKTSAFFLLMAFIFLTVSFVTAFYGRVF